MKMVIAMLSVVFLLCSTSVYTQGSQGRTGIGVSLVNPGIKYFAVPNADIIIPIWINSKFVVQPRLGYTKQDDPAQFRLGVDIYSHFREGEKMSPYATFGGLLFFDNKDLAGKSQTDQLFNIGLGGEYFWNEMASIGGDTGMLYTKSGASHSKAFIGTYGQVLLKWYLK